MTYGLLLEIAWKSLVTTGAALLLLALLKGRTAGERSWVAHAGLLATLLLPAAVVLLPNWQVDAPMALRATAPMLASLGEGAVSPVTGSAAEVPMVDLWALSVWVYALPALLLLIATLVAVLRLFAIRRRADVMVEPAWLSALAHAQRRMGFKHGTALLVSRELTSPVSWGLLRPIILLHDEAVLARDDAEAIIAHELAHVARLDWAKLILARTATALFWFNPLVWILARHCHQLREEAADDAVLRSDVGETEYAALLVAAARHENNGMLLAAHGVAPGRDSLKRRVTRILDKTQSRAPARAGWIAICSTGAILISAPLAALTPATPIPASAETVASLDRPLVLNVPVNLGKPAPGPVVHALAAEAAAPVQPDPVARRVARDARDDDPPGPSLRPDGRPTPDALVTMRAHGVTPEFAGALAATSSLYSRLTPEELVALRDHGVTPEQVRELAGLGYRDLGIDTLTAMRDHGVTPAYIREIGALGYRGLSIDTLTAMRNQGVTPAYIREFRASGYDVTAEELIEMRIHGVSLGPPRDRHGDP